MSSTQRFDERMRERARHENAQMRASFAELAGSVAGGAGRETVQADRTRRTDEAIARVMAYYGATMADVPHEVGRVADRLDYALRPTGIMRRRVHLESDWYRHATGALLGALDTGEVVALLPTMGFGYAYCDPATGNKVRVDNKTAARIEADAWCFYRPFPLKSMSFKSFVGFVLHTLDRADYAMVVIATLVATGIGFLPAAANNDLFSTALQRGSMGMVLAVAVLLAGVVLAQVLISVTKGLIMERVALKLDLQMRAATMMRLLSLPPTFFRDYSAGDLAMRSTLLSSLASVLVDALLGTGLVSVMSLAYLFQVFAFTPALFVPALLVIMADVLIVGLCTWGNMRWNRKRIEAGAQYSGIVAALLRGTRKVKLAGAERRAYARWAHAYAKYAATLYRRPWVLRATAPLVGLAGGLGYAAMYALASANGVALEDFMAFNVSFGMTLGAVVTLAGTASSLAGLRPTLEAVSPLLKAAPEVAENREPVSELNGSIEFSNVSFRYEEDAPLVVDGLSLTINKGESLAIVGRTGCGKSTVIRLLLGFEKPSRGAVYFDGVDASTLDVQSLRAHIGTVLQDDSLFMDSILANIVINAPEATLDDAWDAARMVGMEEDIRKMPMGMHTVLAEGGGGISGGQRQRLMLARALISKPSIIVLDEATSALDNTTQSAVMNTLNNIDATRIYVAHRLSTIQGCDRIVVLDKGHIAESGTYEQLVARGGEFADLVEHQRLD